MNIALDYDNTFSRQRDMWWTFVLNARDWGNDIRIVTSRNPDLDKIEDSLIEYLGLKVIYTNGVAKKFFCENFADLPVDVWIDDKPESILENSSLTPQQLDEWRKNRDV